MPRVMSFEVIEIQDPFFSERGARMRKRMQALRCAELKGEGISELRLHNFILSRKAGDKLTKGKKWERAGMI